jgi:hypothetical protein
MTLLSDWGMAPNHDRTNAEVNRAFSAESFRGCPRLEVNNAPLALIDRITRIVLPLLPELSYVPQVLVIL